MTSEQPRRDGEATRQRLLRSALELYTTIGFRATTTPAIASRAGVAEGTIYRHFSGKEHLLNEVYRNAQRWGAAMVRESEIEQAPAGRLALIARRLLETAAQDPPLTRMLLRRREEQHLDEQSRQTAREFHHALHEVVASGASDGQLRSGPTDFWTDIWLALVAYTVERVGAGEWTLDGPSTGMAIDAAWDAISVRDEAPAERH